MFPMPVAAVIGRGSCVASALVAAWRPGTRRGLGVSATCAAKRQQMPSRPKPPPEDEIDEVFIKGSGPGGQKINKTNSAVQLRHRPTGIVVKSQATRSRSQNRAIARGLLAARLDELHNGAASRTAVVGAAKVKKRANATKKSRRKYRKLIEGDEDVEDDVLDDVNEGGDTVGEKITVLTSPGTRQDDGEVVDSTRETINRAGSRYEGNLDRAHAWSH